MASSLRTRQSSARSYADTVASFDTRLSVVQSSGLGSASCSWEQTGHNNNYIKITCSTSTLTQYYVAQYNTAAIHMATVSLSELRNEISGDSLSPHCSTRLPSPRLASFDSSRVSHALLSTTAMLSPMSTVARQSKGRMSSLSTDRHTRSVRTDGIWP